MAAMEVSGLRINLFFSEKKIRNTRICCFSLSFMIVNEILLGSGLLAGQNNDFQDINLGSEKLW